jgi:hypothetical protein
MKKSSNSTTHAPSKSSTSSHQPMKKSSESISHAPSMKRAASSPPTPKKPICKSTSKSHSTSHSPDKPSTKGQTGRCALVRGHEEKYSKLPSNTTGGIQGMVDMQSLEIMHLGEMLNAENNAY